MSIGGPGLPGFSLAPALVYQLLILPGIRIKLHIKNSTSNSLPVLFKKMFN